MGVYMEEEVQVFEGVSSESVDGDTNRLVGICCDSRCIAVSLRSGEFFLYSWGTTFLGRGSPIEPRLSRAPSDAELSISTQLSDCVLSVYYSPSLNLMTIVFENGCVGIAHIEGGLTSLSENRCRMWLAYATSAPQDAALKASIHPFGSYLAIGLFSSRVIIVKIGHVLCNVPNAANRMRNEDIMLNSDGLSGKKIGLHSSTSRVLGLEEWGFSSVDLGPVSSLAWSFDGKVIAVGYKKRGFAVWTLLGCRLFCSLSHEHAKMEYRGPFSPKSPEALFSSRSGRLFPGNSLGSSQNGGSSPLPASHGHLENDASRPSGCLEVIHMYIVHATWVSFFHFLIQDLCVDVAGWNFECSMVC